MRLSETGIALTYDDISLVPAYSAILPNDTDVSTRLTERIHLPVPLISAAMDTVTDARMAIAIARHGGIGFIHRNMPVEQQAQEVAKVKKSEYGMVIDPITVDPDQSIADAKELMSKFRISGVPVVKEQLLVGIITNRDIRFEEDMAQSVREVMTKERLVTAPLGTSLQEAKKILHKNRIEKLLITDPHGRLCGLITVKDISKIEQFPDSCKDGLGRLRVGAAVGVGEKAVIRASALIEAGVDAICVDSAHGHSIGVVDTVIMLRYAFPKLDIIAGNVATANAADSLALAGANCIKVGVGPGSICTTRIVAGVGVPQATAIYDCVDTAKKADVALIADGGIKYSGDIVKALAIGADAVMIGNLFAGTDEAPGELVSYGQQLFKVYRGMGSIGAMKEGSADRYGQDDFEPSKLVAEGVEGRVPYVGPLAEMVQQLIGGLRAGMGYLGCPTIRELRQSRIVRITEAGKREAHVHDVIITKEPPNYRKQ